MDNERNEIVEEIVNFDEDEESEETDPVPEVEESADRDVEESKDDSGEVLEANADRDVEESEDDSDNEFKEAMQLINSETSSSEERENNWVNMCKIFEESMEVKAKQFRRLIGPIIKCLEEEGESKVKAAADKDNYEVKSQALLCLGEIALHNFEQLGVTQKRVIVDLLTTNWGKQELFEGITKLFEQLSPDEAFINIFTKVVTKNILPSFATTLALVDDRMNQEAIVKVLGVFSKFDRSQFQKECIGLKHSYIDQLLKNFLLGSLAYVQAQAASSQYISEIFVLEFPKQEWQDLGYWLKKNLEQANHTTLIGTLQVIEKICDSCLTEGILELKELIDELFVDVFNVMKKGRRLEAVKTLQSMMLCNPASINHTKKRQTLMKNLAQSLNSMEESLKEQILRDILSRLVVIDRADPMHNRRILAEMEELLNA